MAQSRGETPLQRAKRLELEEKKRIHDRMKHQNEASRERINAHRQQSVRAVKTKTRVDNIQDNLLNVNDDQKAESYPHAAVPTFDATGILEFKENGHVEYNSCIGSVIHNVAPNSNDINFAAT